MVGTGGGGLSGNGITKAFVDVSGPQARGEQAERRNQKTAVHTEKLIPICDSQLEGADGLGRRNEINHDKEVGRAVSQGASYESENLAFNSIPVELVQDRRSGKLCIYRLGVLDVVAVDPVSALLHRFAVHRTEALGFDQSHRAVEFRGVVGTGAPRPSIQPSGMMPLIKSSSSGLTLPWLMFLLKVLSHSLVLSQVSRVKSSF